MIQNWMFLINGKVKRQVMPDKYSADAHIHRVSERCRLLLLEKITEKAVKVKAIPVNP
ncbi:hypothetical protein [Leptospirillum ferriphilum]|jgi:hypothetical protein|uniref:hypothetical protein n=1 Tax=Leptospirillum ferriphilum TaxID=178606 RepID=UPI001377D204|nr:hypothetical protein [Leptospirillum ferriphilum]MCL4405688.1 hypothetical protein [Bacillota bacterium]